MITVKAKFDTNAFKRQVLNLVDKRKKNYVQRAKEIVRDTLRYNINSIAPAIISSYAPSYRDERDYLSLGVDTRTGRLLGSSDGGRFIKNPRYKYVRDAINDYLKFNINYKGDDYKYDIEFEVPESVLNRINESIGFGWMKKVGRNSLISRSTSDAGSSGEWRTLLTKWEYGGVLNVKPRDSGDVLHPGPDKKTTSKEMTKTIPPYRMFYNGMKQVRQLVFNKVKLNLKNRLSKS